MRTNQIKLIVSLHLRQKFAFFLFMQLNLLNIQTSVIELFLTHFISKYYVKQRKHYKLQNFVFNRKKLYTAGSRKFAYTSRFTTKYGKSNVF